MKFYIEDVLVYFPYQYIYPEQYSYMVALKKALDRGGPCVLEMPSGTGKTVSLLALITSYQVAKPEAGKLIYCSRTVPEIEQVLQEAKKVLKYRDAELGLNAPKSLCIGMSSRRNLCIHPRVSEEREGRMVDSKCRDLTISWQRDKATTDNTIETCDFFESFEKTGKDTLLSGVYSLDDLKEFGRTRGWCPYYLARHMLNFANIVVYSYNYMLDPKISSLISKELKANSIVVFDEAHNIDNVCIGALSININSKIIDGCARNLLKLSNTISTIKQVDADRLKREYARLVQGLASSGANPSDEFGADPVLPADVIQEAVPGNIRKAEHFVELLKRLVEYLRVRLRVHQVVTETPLAFMQHIYNAASIDARTLKFCSTRLNSLIRTLEIADMSQFSPISVIADFATLVGTYNDGFTLLIEPYDERTPNLIDPVMQYCCLDASLALKPVIDKFHSVVITSGTISPLDMYTKILNFRPVLVESLRMSLDRSCVCPLIVTRGSDQVTISSRYEVRNDMAVVRNFGNLLVEMSAIVPDGLVCFFTSYLYMEQIVAMWNEMGLLNGVLANKLIFVETPDANESSLALQNYKKACDSGRGAVLLAVARGKVSEGIDFDNQYGRCVINFGIPFVYTESRVLKARLEFMRDRYQIKEKDFLTFDAMRTTAQCVGRVIRGKHDYGIMIFADKRFNRADKRGKLPQWVQSFITPGHMNLSTDMSVGLAKVFLKEMAQPYSRASQLGKSLWALEHVEKQLPSRPKPAGSTAPTTTNNTSNNNTTHNNGTTGAPNGSSNVNPNSFVARFGGV